MKPKRLPPGTPIDVRLWSKVEKTDECWNWTDALTASGYGRLLVERRTKQAHRIAWELEHGPIPAGFLLDHICHNTRCVRPAHLRLATPKQNNEYRKGAQINNLTSGVRGVYPARQPGTWYAVIKDNYKQVHIGTFYSIEDAEAAVKAERARRFSFPDAA